MSKEKTDWVLGQHINKFLLEKGVETPTTIPSKIVDNSDKIKKITELYSEIMDVLQLDRDDSSLKDTPKRVAKMYVNEIFEGLDYNNFPSCTLFDVKHDEMITVNNIKVMSVCEHHIQNITGFCHVAYIPKKGCIGLSKINRIVDFFARRPQVQERLTEQVYYALSYILGTEDVAVNIVADHFCVKARGIGDQNSFTTTSKLGGCFKNDSDCRKEFFSQVNSNKFVCH